MAFTVRSLLSLAGRVVRAVSSQPGTVQPGRQDTPDRRRSGHRAAPSLSPLTSTRRQQTVLAYSPSADGHPDPGEIVWTWVPYEDDPVQGKDRPVLLVGRDGDTLLGLMLTSRDRNNSRGHDARYVDVGAGDWDPQGRPSEVKIDRLLRLDPRDIRREGAVLPRQRFEQVVAAIPDHLLDQGDALR